MGEPVDVWVWRQFSMAPDTELDWTFWITGADGISMIDPEHFYWMSAVPDYEPSPNPDLPAYATGLTITEQGASRLRIPRRRQQRRVERDAQDCERHRRGIHLVQPAHARGAGILTCSAST